MPATWNAIKSLLANPAIVTAGPGLDLFLLDYMRKFRLREVGGHVIVHSHLPPLNSKAYGRFVNEHLVRRNDGPSHAQIAVTSACPQHCTFCYNRDRTGKQITSYEILRTIDALADLGVFWLGLTGGEPLLETDLARIVEHAAGRCSVKLFTTGCALTPELARDLKRAGLFSVSVSLDHWDEQVHDSGRHYPGAFKAALQAIATFQEAGLDTGVSAVLSKEMVTKGETATFVAFLEGLGVHEIWLSETKPSVQAFWDEALLITDAERNALIALQDRHNREGGATLNYLGHFESADHFGCTAGRKMVYVDAFGEVSPCVFMPMTFGNIRQRPLAEIVDEMRRAFRLGSTCCISSHWALLRERAAGGLPLPPEQSREMVKGVSFTPASRFFALHERRFGAPS
jgi:MoaA/NifB/PqqE/SkfB family radical SAM enzyme